MQELLKSIPGKPGVYKMKDGEGRVLYVGKAKDLKKRVSMYFKKDYQHSYRTRALVGHIKDIEYIQTDTELEALILENTIIKQLKPKYNILMKDDKSYVYVKIDTREDFPRVKVLREHGMEHAGKEQGEVKYFGPKLASSHVYDTLTILKKLFPYRHCNLDIAWNGSTQVDKMLKISPESSAVTVTNKVIDFPCLDYHIKRCPGPCIGAVTPEGYGKMIKAVIDFFSGKTDAIVEEIESQMRNAATDKNFELAAKLRDKLEEIKALTEKQKMSDPNRVDTDVINCTAHMGHLYYSILIIRKGKIIDQQQYTFDALESGKTEGVIETADAHEFFESFLKQYYERTSEVPKEILIPIELESEEVLESWLSAKKGSNVHVLTPQKGEKNNLLELAFKNAENFAKQHRIKWLAEKQNEQALEMLADAIGLKGTALKRIEGFDISHLAGNETVGSMVVFEEGKAKTSDYRHFKMRTVVGKPNDFKSMEEVLTRRLKYLALQESKRGLRLSKISKKQLKELDKTHSNYWVAQLNKEIVAYVGVEKLTDVGPVISDIWIDPKVSEELIGFALLDKMNSQLKQKKIYIVSKDEQHDFFATYGCVPLVKVTEPLKLFAEEQKIDRPVFMLYQVAKKTKVDNSFTSKPDLLLIDGGKGQLGVAVEVLQKLKLTIPVISLAKKLEEIFIPGITAPVLLDQNNEALRLLQHVRDESHRFAITFQRKLHIKGMYQ